MRAIVKISWLATLGLALALAAQADEAADAKAVDARAAEAGPATAVEAAKPAAKEPNPPVVYVPPSRGAARDRTGAGTRGVSVAPTLAALAPDHVGLTNRAQPTFAWFVSAGTAARVDFTLTTADEVDPVLEVMLPGPMVPGIQLVHLADHGAQLDEGESYAWSVALVPDPARRDLDVVAGGSVRREPAAPEVVAAIAAGTPSYLALARGGVWYDAMADLSEAIAAHPQDAALRAERAVLLEQVGVGAAAAYERENR